jgi:hypothetical protein
MHGQRVFDYLAERAHYGGAVDDFVENDRERYGGHRADRVFRGAHPRIAGGEPRSHGRDRATHFSEHENLVSDSSGRCRNSVPGSREMLRNDSAAAKLWMTECRVDKSIELSVECDTGEQSRKIIANERDYRAL